MKVGALIRARHAAIIQASRNVEVERSTMTSLSNGLVELKAYLEVEAKTKNPLPYETVARLFGELDTGHVEEVTKNAIRDRVQERVKKTLQDSQKENEGKDVDRGKK